MLAPAHKPKTCAYCETRFTPVRSMQVVCSPICAKRKVAADKAKGKRELRERKAALARLPELKEIAQRDFNAFIRLRDRRAGWPCVSCARPLDWSGNQVDAGHWRSVGAAPHLRYDERNVHAQCKHCNKFRAGNAVDYRISLIARIGLEAVEALESDNSVRKWTREELIAIRDTYKAKLKQLKEQA